LEGNFFEGDIYGVKLTSLKGDGGESSSEEGLDSKNAIKNTFQKWPRCSTCPLVLGCWELSHVIFLMLRKKELLAKLSKFTK
jgi:hypothetical protein